MAITLRTVKGSTLTYAELDGNFTDLDTRVSNIETSSLNSVTYTADASLLYASGTYDFGNNIITYANAVDQEADLANYDPSTYHGMTMHVHSTGALYYAHAGDWRKLLTDTTYNNIESEGYVDSLSAVAYSGDYNSLSNTPTVPANVDDLSDVVASGATSGQILKYDGTNWVTSAEPIANVVDDTSPQLGGDLDVNGNSVLHTFGIVNNGTSAYTFSDEGNHWFPTTEDNPVLYLRRGETYVFDINASGHPFEIRVSDGGSSYDTGVTNNGAEVGQVEFKVPMSAPSTLYYQCTVHAVMGNTINIV